MREARQIEPYHNTRYDVRAPRCYQAALFSTGLILSMAVRTPMRARNWCEARLGVNLKRGAHGWHWHFAGDELKIGTRAHGTRVNVFDPPVNPAIVPALEAYLDVYRPHLPQAAQDDHVFLSARGGPLTATALRSRMKIQVYRHTGKRLYSHLIRSLFMTQHLTAGVDINTVAYGMNDVPNTVLQYYNEVIAERHQPILDA